MSFEISMSAPVPFRMPQNFYEECVLFDSNNNPLGTPLEIASRRWNDGELSRDVGENRDLPVVDAPVILMDNGYSMLVPVDITVHLSVSRQLYYGQLSVPKISAFKDEQTGLVITNAFEVGFIDPNTVQRDWKEIADESEAEVRSVIKVFGLVSWPA